MIPKGTDAISPAPHHDIYSIEDLRQLVYSLKEATRYEKPIIVKVAAVHNIAAIASGIARSGADIIAIDGFRGGTGAAITRTRDNVGIPIELALASVDARLRDEGIRNNVSLVVGGSIRSSADVVKAIALGADACYIGTAALLAMGCHLCRTCQSGKCNWGIATQRPELVKRLNPGVAAPKLVNLLTAWNHEIEELMCNVQAIRPDAIEFADLVIECCEAMQKLVEEMPNFKKSKTLEDLIVEINRLEELGDDLYARSMRALHTSNTDPLDVVVWREIYAYFEKCCDGCEHVADIVEGICIGNR